MKRFLKPNPNKVTPISPTDAEQIQSFYMKYDDWKESKEKKDFDARTKDDDESLCNCCKIC